MSVAENGALRPCHAAAEQVAALRCCGAVTCPVATRGRRSLSNFSIPICTTDLGNELDCVGPFVGAGCGRAHDCKGSSAELVSDLVVLENSIFSPVD